MRPHPLRWASLPLVMLVTASCGSSATGNVTCSGLPPPAVKNNADYRMAFAQAGAQGANPARLAEAYSMQTTAASRGLRLKVFDASDNDVEQLSQVSQMTSQGFDAIFLQAVNLETMAPAVVAAREACIPVFLVGEDVDHAVAVPAQDFVTFVGADYVQQGNLMANWLLAHATGPQTVVELVGPSSLSSALLRQQGFDAAVKGIARISVIQSLPAENQRAAARSGLSALLRINATINAVVAFNDEMGLGALDALTDPRNTSFLNGKKAGADIRLISADGQQAVIRAISAGTYSSTVFTLPYVGPAVFDAWSRYRQGAALDPLTPLQSTVIDAANAASSALPAF